MEIKHNYQTPTANDPGSEVSATRWNEAHSLVYPFEESRWVFQDFHYAGSVSYHPFIAAAVSSGTAAVNTAAKTENHGSILALRDSTTANGGYTFYTSIGLISKQGMTYRSIFYVPNVATANKRMGFTNQVVQTLTANNFAILAIDGLSCYGATRVNGGTIANDSANAVTLTANTWYTLDIEWITATTVRFTVFDDSLNIAYTWDSTAGLWPNPRTSALVAFAGAWETTTNAAQDCLVLDYIGFGPAKPAFIVTPV